MRYRDPIDKVIDWSKYPLRLRGRIRYVRLCSVCSEQIGTGDPYWDGDRRYAHEQCGTGPVRLVFLDIDGVLNSIEAWDRLGRGDRIDDRAVDILNQIIIRSQWPRRFVPTCVVVSSTWRIGRSTSELRLLLKRHGFAGRLIGRTDVLDSKTGGPGRERADEIAKWMGDRPWLVVSSFVVLDDDPIASVHHPISDRLVQIDAQVGLTAADVDKAVTILSREDL